MDENTFMKTENFIRQACRFAATSPQSDVGEFPNPYGPDENPYEDQLFKMEVQYDPSTQTLTLIPYTGRYDDDEKKPLQIQLTDEQAKVLDVFEDSIHKEHVEHINDANGEALENWGYEYAQRNGFGKDPFVFHDRKANVINIYPNQQDASRTYTGPGVTIPVSQVSREVNLMPPPARKVWRKPPDIEA